MEEEYPQPNFSVFSGAAHSSGGQSLASYNNGPGFNYS
jgi:hypothetical protein